MFGAKDVRLALFLTVLAGMIGVWSITSSVVITRDGVAWIEAAQNVHAKLTGALSPRTDSWLPVETLNSSNTGWDPRCRHLFFPLNGQIGFSVGVNGIAVFERQNAYFPALAVFQADMATHWNHVAITYQNKRSQVYLNGRRVWTGLISARNESFSPARLLGGHENPGLGNFRGAVRDVRVWSRALADEEMPAAANGHASRDGLVGHWPFEEGAGDWAMDRSQKASKVRIKDAQWVDRNEGAALLFDGTNNPVQLTFPKMQDCFTIAAQVKVSEPGTATMPVARDAGYPVLLAIWRIVLGAFGLGDSSLDWALAGQTLGLLCRMLSLFPLFYIGKRLVGSADTFWALIILVVLPWPAQWAHDALREWPQLLFLSTGLLLMVHAFRTGKLTLLLGIGLVAGLGHTIRAECAQVVLYAQIGLCMAIWRPTASLPRSRSICGALLLVAGFSIVFFPYARYRGRYMPGRIQELLAHDRTVSTAEEPPARQHAGFAKQAEGAGLLVQQMSENQMYYFFPFTAVGLFVFLRRRERRRPSGDAWWLVAFIVLNAAMCIVLFSHWGHMGRRYVLPLTAITGFFTPLGMKTAAGWLSRPRNDSVATSHESKRQKVFVLLMVIGVAICLPKLVRPRGISHIGLRKTADFLRQNTPTDAIIAVPDPRIGFYANRSRKMYEVRPPSGKWDYVVVIEEGDENSRIASPALDRMYAHPLRPAPLSDNVVVYRRNPNTATAQTH